MLKEHCSHILLHLGFFFFCSVKHLREGQFCKDLGELLIFIRPCTPAIICGFMRFAAFYDMNACSLIEAMCLQEAVG